MAITINVADIKRKAMVDSAETAYDSSIQSLIAEMQGPIEYSIADAYLNDTLNANLQATLKLAMLEIITGEFLQQLRRELGSTEQIAIGGVTIGANEVSGIDLIHQGATRLAPFLKSTLPMISESGTISNTADEEPCFAVDEGVW